MAFIEVNKSKVFGTLIPNTWLGPEFVSAQLNSIIGTEFIQ